MTYSIGTDADLPAIAELLATTQLDSHVTYKGGHWVLAKDGDEVRACIWFFAEPPVAYIDCWAGSGIPAVVVAGVAENVLRDLGVERVFGTIEYQNHRALNTMFKRFNVRSDGHAYYLVYKDIDNGTAKD